MVRDSTEHGVHFTRVSLEDLLNPVDENAVTEEPTLQELGREIAGVDVDPAEKERDSEGYEGVQMSIEKS